MLSGRTESLEGGWEAKLGRVPGMGDSVNSRSLEGKLDMGTWDKWPIPCAGGTGRW